MKKALHIVLGLVLFLGFFSNGLKAQEVFQPYKTNAVPYHGYLYPVIPGTEEWIALGSYEARLESVQLPIDTLKDISTARLLESCIYNPFMIDVWALDDYIYSMELMRSRLNCLEEFYNREDALCELVSLYSSRQVEFVFEIQDPYDHGRYHMDYAIMELMMAYMNSIMDFSSKDIKDVVTALLDKTYRWELYYDEYGAAYKGDVLLLMGRLLNKEGAFGDYQGATLFYFLETGCCMDVSSCESDFNYIMQVARRFTDIEENAIDQRVVVFPNPTNGLVKVVGNEIERIETYSIIGQMVKETEGNVLDLSDQEPGTYIIKVITPSGTITNQIIKK